MDIIGKKIRTLRKNKNMTQERLAEVLSVSSQAIMNTDAIKITNNSNTPFVIFSLNVIFIFFTLLLNHRKPVQRVVCTPYLKQGLLVVFAN